MEARHTHIMTGLHFAGGDFIADPETMDDGFLYGLKDCGTPGQPADDAVQYVLDTYEITGDPVNCAAYLRVFGAWDDDELADHDKNLARLVWLTGCELREDDEVAYFSTY